MAKDILVVVVENDPGLRDLVQRALEEEGYDVLSAGAVSEAITLLAQEANTCRGLVTDVGLGGSDYTGWNLARDARELMPYLAVVYITGAHGDEWSANGVEGSVLLSKPFDPDHVVAALSRLLGPAAPVR